MTSRQQEALVLATEILDDIELSKLPAVNIVRKASRLARIVDDTESVQWLQYEIIGYSEKTSLDTLQWSAAGKSGRIVKDDKGKELAHVSSVGSLQAKIDALKLQLSASQTNGASVDAYIEAGRRTERQNLGQSISNNQAVLDKVTGSIYIYVTNLYQEFRFGAAVETVFENVREDVDSKISSLVPNALPILTTALENAQTDDQNQWNNAAKACRDLIKAAADALRPAGPDKNGIKMTDDKYINRLMDWIQTNLSKGTKRDLVSTDLDHLGKRLDAVTGGGNKGAHTDVNKADASRFIVGTYLVLGDILNLHKEKSD